MTAQPSAEQREINRNVILVAAAFALAAAAGLARNMVIARQFGIGADLDAYYAAFKLPDLLFTVVAGGALATAFIPLFVDFLPPGIGQAPGASQGRSSTGRSLSQEH